jgi:hypothetical protein
LGFNNSNDGIVQIISLVRAFFDQNTFLSIYFQRLAIQLYATLLIYEGTFLTQIEARKKEKHLKRGVGRDL